MVEKIEINLIPLEYRVHQRRFVLKKEVLIPILISAILVIVATSWLGFLNGRISTVTSEITRIESEIRRNKPIQDEIHVLQKKQKSMLAKVNGLKEIKVNRENWVRLSEEFSREIPVNSWLTKITQKKDDASTIELVGVTEAFGEVGQYMARLMETPRFAVVKLVEIKDKNKSGDMLEFKINVTLGSSDGTKTGE
jgi:Tfp pilus assembly protein PilN